MGFMDSMKQAVGGGPPPQAPSDGALDLSQVPTEHLTSMLQDPKFLAASAMVFLQHGQPQGLHWLEQAHAAAKENAFEALSRLEADDGEGAIKAFNQSGRYTDATGAQKNDDGTWTLTRKNGQTATIDPIKARKSLLTPAEFFKQDNEEKKTAIAAQQAKTMEGYRADQGDYYRRLADNKDEANRVREEGAAETNRVRQLGVEATAQARQAAAEAKAALADHKLTQGPLVENRKLLTKLIEQGDPDAQKKADAALASDPDVTPVVKKDGTVGLFHVESLNERGEPTTRPYRTFASAKEYEALTGRKLPAGAAPAGAPAAPVKEKTQGFVRQVASNVVGGGSDLATWAKTQNDQTLAAVVAKGGPTAQAAQAELERRKSAQPEAAPVDDAPPGIIRGPNVPRRMMQ